MKLSHESLKKVALGVAVLGVLVIGANRAEARDFTIALSTYVPTASAGEFTLGTNPDIAGGVRVRQVILANGGATAQDVSIYDTCTSSTAATLAGVISVPASIGTEYVPPTPVIQGLWTLTNPCFTKSSTSSVVHATLLYE